MAALDPTKTPVIVGIGEITERPEDLSKAREPVDLMADALRAADEDAGASLLDSLTYVGVVGLLTWPYRDPARLVCDRLEINPARAVNESFGGETPTRLVHEAAVRIAKGEAEAAAIVGGEAISSLRKSRKANIDVSWTPRPPRDERFTFEFMYLELSESANTAGVKIPADIYPLFENAYANAKGQTPAQAIETAADLWSEYARVARTNPYAWNQSGMSADDIATVSKDNCRVAFPYSKYMVANSSVNQAAAMVVTSLAHAREMGVSDDKLIYVHGGAYAAEPGDYLLRDNYSHVPAQEAVLEAGVELAGGGQNIDALELYSCFPVVPKMARETLETLGLSADMPPTVAGGLTFFGGPLNNYMAHATCAMVRELREGESKRGLLYGQGGVSTKHHTLLLSNTPSDKPLALEYSVQAAADAKRGPAPERLDHYTGPATVETYTIKYGTAGKLQYGVVVTRTPEGARVLARVRREDEISMALLTSTEASPIGREGHIRVDSFGRMVWEEGVLRDRRTRKPEFCQVERDGHLTIVTINRPDVMNSLTPMANEELAEIFDHFQSDPDQWVAILTGAGDKAFSAGNDLVYSAKVARNGEMAEAPLTGFAGLTARYDLSKPVIAAVNGFAMGGGFEIALACDLIVAAENATFALPEPKVGLAALAGGLHRLPRQIGLKQAMGMILTARRVSAEEGQALGFVNEVVPSQDLMATARRWADEIMACSPMSIRASKQIALNGLNDASIEEAFNKQNKNSALRVLFRSHDIVEGPRAFAEKRDPEWKGE